MWIPPLTFFWSTKKTLQEGIEKVKGFSDWVIVKGKRGEVGRDHLLWES